MIVTGIFLFLLATIIGKASTINSEVKYEGPSKITVTEEIDQNLPSQPPASTSSYVHQGSNYFFGPQYPATSQFSPPVIETIVAADNGRKNCNNKNLNSCIFGERIINMKRSEVVETLRGLPIPNMPLKLQPVPYLSAVPALSESSQIISLPPIPSWPSFKVPKAPILIKEPIKCPGELVISEFDVEIKKIPSPPELPPLILEEIVKPVIVEEKKIILVPSLPEPQSIIPPSLVMSERPTLTTLCAQNIVFERILPNIAFEKTKTVELISIPASKRVPVVTAPLLPFLKK